MQREKKTCFWIDAWLIDEPLIKYTLRDVPYFEITETIASYWVNDQWDMQRLNQWLPTYILARLQSVCINLDMDKEDSWGWKMPKSGMFSIKSSYPLIDKGNVSTLSNLWDKIWKLWCPQRCISFLWLVKHGRLMTNKERCRRGFTISPYCDYYGDTEDILHVLLDCSQYLVISFGTSNKDVC